MTSVASACTVGRVPVKRPKFDSSPQIATIVAGDKPVAVAADGLEGRGLADDLVIAPYASALHTEW
jgi:hypothetical protein